MAARNATLRSVAGRDVGIWLFLEWRIIQVSMLHTFTAQPVILVVSRSAYMWRSGDGRRQAGQGGNSSQSIAFRAL